MNIRTDLQQGSLQWLEARAGVLTASEAKNLVTPKWKIRTGEMVETLVATKLAEKWIGPLPSFSAFATEQGNILEESAIPAYEIEYGVEVKRVGLILSDDGRTGCSPDGLLGDDCGLEIKSLQPVHHCKCLMDGGVPEDYLAQIHFSLWVTGFPQWKLFCYQRRFPCLTFTIERDQAIMDTIQMAVEDFLDRLEIEYQRLVEKNGGPPPPRKVFVPSSDVDPRTELFQGVIP